MLGRGRYYRIFAGVALSFLGNDAAAKTKLDAISAKMSYAQAPSALTYKTDHCEVLSIPLDPRVVERIDCLVAILKSRLRAEAPQLVESIVRSLQVKKMVEAMYVQLGTPEQMQLGDALLFMLGSCLLSAWVLLRSARSML